MIESDVFWLWFEIMVNLFQGCLVSFFYSKMLTAKFVKKWLSMVCAVSYACCCSSYLFFDMPEVDTWVFVIPVIYSVVCFNGSVWEKVFWNAVLISVFLGVTNLFYLVIASTLGVEFESLLEPSINRVLFVVSGNVGLMVALFAVTRIKNKYPGNSWSLIIFGVMNFFSIWIIDLLFLMRIMKTANDFISILASVLTLGISVLSIALFVIISKYEEQKYDNQRKLDKVVAEEKRIDELRTLYTSLQGLRHDIKNHLQIATALVEDGKKEESAEYIRKIESNVFSVFATGCFALDSALTIKELDMRHHGIMFRYNLCELSRLPVSDLDLCTIISNLLDNAIEAIIRLDDRNIVYEIELYIHHFREMLYIECRNPVNENKIEKKDGHFMSTKRTGKPGIGIQNIEAIVKRIHGFSTFCCENQQFVALIALPYNDK